MPEHVEALGYAIGLSLNKLLRLTQAIPPGDPAYAGLRDAVAGVVEVDARLRAWWAKQAA
jgi:hypothetical protein